MNKNPKNILIVDDEVDNCQNLEDFLAMKGHHPRSAHNGLEAMDKIKEKMPDVVLLDIRMPGMDGIETLKEIRNINEDVVVIMLTAVDNVDTALKTVKMGADDFVRKPVELPEVIYAMDSALEKKRLIIENRDYQHNLEKKVAEQTKSLRDLNLALQKTNIEVTCALSEAIEAKDSYTRGHCQRIAEFSLRLGKEIELSKKDLTQLEYAALLHDIGKIGIPAEVLNKPGKLTREERDCIEKHPVIGEKILFPIEFFKEIKEVVKHHHEWVNGEGYPDHLMENQLDIMSKIVAIADVYDALTSDRPYRVAMPQEKALSILKENSSTQFNKKLLDIFISKKLYVLENSK